jgi:hypothetical protein
MDGWIGERCYSRVFDPFFRSSTMDESAVPLLRFGVGLFLFFFFLLLLIIVVSSSSTGTGGSRGASGRSDGSGSGWGGRRPRSGRGGSGGGVRSGLDSLSWLSDGGLALSSSGGRRRLLALARSRSGLRLALRSGGSLLLRGGGGSDRFLLGRFGSRSVFFFVSSRVDGGVVDRGVPCGSCVSVVGGGSGSGSGGDGSGATSARGRVRGKGRRRDSRSSGDGLRLENALGGGRSRLVGGFG